MPAPEKFRIGVARFPGGSIMPIDMPDTTEYYAQILEWLKHDSRCSEVLRYRVSDTPITMSRNLVIESALQDKIDYLVMLDNDMSPDMYLGIDPYAEPFLPTALKFSQDRWDVGPHIIGAPYCGPPPCENVYVFRWATNETDDPNEGQFGLEQYTREEAALRVGFEEVAALPTGLILFDMRVFRDVLKKKPFFYYQWRNDSESAKSSTEDVTMTRDASIAGAKCWCLWSAWAGHYKLKCVGRPKLMSSDQVGAQMKVAVKRDWKLPDRVLNMGKPGGFYIPEIVRKDMEKQNGQVQSDGGGRGTQGAGSEVVEEVSHGEQSGS